MNVVIVGGGAAGCITGMMLARDGHTVTILERDAEGPPDDNEAAWETWKRTGVNQLRQPHGFLGRTRQTLMSELPDLWQRISKVHTYTVDLKEFSPARAEPEAPGDELLRVEVMRRSTFERLATTSAEEEPNLTFHRGVAIKGVTTRGGAHPPIITGVITDAGEFVSAELVIDAAGRRTSSPNWLREVGAEVFQWSESDGFTYHSMWFRTHDGAYPELTAGFFGGFAPGLLALIFPGDDGVFGIPLVGLGSDKLLRALRDPDKFTDVVRRMEPIAHWVDTDVSLAITDVKPMGAIQNRRLRFWAGDRPSALGMVNVADSAMSTNPSLGRGIALACWFALELRGLLRETEDLETISIEYDRIQEELFRPFLDDAVESDRSSRNFLAAALGQQVVDGSPSPRSVLSQAASQDPEIWRRWQRVNQVFDTPPTCTEDQELLSRAKRATTDAPPIEPHMTRQELAEILS